MLLVSEHHESFRVSWPSTSSGDYIFQAVVCWFTIVSVVRIHNDALGLEEHHESFGVSCSTSLEFMITLLFHQRN